MIDQIFEFLQDESISLNLWRMLLYVGATGGLLFFVQWFFPWLATRFPERRLQLLAGVPPSRLVILLLGLFVISLSIFGQERIFTISFFVVLGIGFAFQDYVSSIIAGMVAIFEQPYQPGDWVSIDGDYGTIKSMGLRSVKVVTPDDSVVTIPHSKIWKENITNANTGQREHMAVANFYLAPDHNSAMVRQRLWDVAITSPYVQLARCVTVIVLEKPWATHYRLKAYPIDGRDEFLFISDLTVRGKEALQSLHISFVQIPPQWQGEESVNVL
jgi:small-conductance mechanosensitive channel